METLYQRKTQVGASVAADTYHQVLKEAARRGITVSELVRHYVEQGLNNPTPTELRKLKDRLSTIEGALKELYEMAVVNWAAVEKEEKKFGQQVALPWTRGAWTNWKDRLSKKGLVDKETGETAYEKLTMPSAYDDTWVDEEEDIQDILRAMWQADGSWSEEEEAQYQEQLRRKAGIKPKAIDAMPSKPKRKARRRRR